MTTTTTTDTAPMTTTPRDAAARKEQHAMPSTSTTYAIWEENGRDWAVCTYDGTDAIGLVADARSTANCRRRQRFGRGLYTLTVGGRRMARV